MMKNFLFIIIIFIFHVFIPITLSPETLHGVDNGRVFIVDHDGNIYTDSNRHSITKYSPMGEVLCIMGQRGEGPGDIKRLGWFALSPDSKSIYVTEFFGGNKWISMFSSQGKYIGEWNCNLDWKNWNGLSVIRFDHNGNIYIQAEKSLFRRHKDFKIISHKRVIIKFSANGKKIKEIFQFEADFNAEKRGKGNVTIPFHNYLYWNIYKGNLIVRESRDNFISIFDLDGNLKKKVLLPFEREKLTKADIHEWEEWMKSLRWVKQGIAEGWFDLKFWRKNLPLPEYKPVSASKMQIDIHGNLYSLKYADAGAKLNLWAKINLMDHKVSVVKSNIEDRLLCVFKDCFFILRPLPQKDDEYNVVKSCEPFFLKFN